MQMLESLVTNKVCETTWFVLNKVDTISSSL